MEHRWGQRWDVERAVQLRTRGGLAARGTVCNVRISGAFVATPLPIRPLSYVQVSFVVEQNARRVHSALEGQVVRVTPRGFALEWCEFAPELVLALSDTGAEPSQEEAPNSVASRSTRR